MSLSKLKQGLAGAVLALGMMSNAQAGLISVKTIEINNALNDWLQVAEVIALDMFNVDMALVSNGATASAPDVWSPSTMPINAIDGNTGGNYSLGEIFHEGNPRTGDTLTIEFATAVELQSIQIFGRSDCCQQRDLYNVSFFDVFGSELFSTQVDSRFRNSPVIELPDTSVAVPNPSGFALIALGWAMLMLRRKKA